jgi:hypothetical protein
MPHGLTPSGPPELSVTQLPVQRASRSLFNLRAKKFQPNSEIHARSLMNIAKHAARIARPS